MSRGKPFEAGNTSGQGRPPGSVNKKSLLLQQMLLDKGEEIVKSVIEDAKKGDPLALKFCVERLVAPLKDVAEQPVEQVLRGPKRLEIKFVKSNNIWDIARLNELLKDDAPQVGEAPRPELPLLSEAVKPAVPLLAPIPLPQSAPRPPAQPVEPRRQPVQPTRRTQDQKMSPWS